MRIALVLAGVLIAGSANGAMAQEAVVSPQVRAAARDISRGEDLDGALRTLEALANEGDLSAHLLLGELYMGLGGVNRDRPRSCEHFRIAREFAASAAHNYGQCLWEGVFGQRELEQARVWYGRAAEGGFVQSNCALGNMLIKGEGGPADPERGIGLCREAAEAGDANAQTDMGDHYGMGEGVEQDYVEARRWYLLAAAQQHRNAAFQLGALDWNGLGGPVDQASASHWFEQSYAFGRAEAAFAAGQTWFIRAVPNAPDGPVDTALLSRAKYWFEIALEQDPDGRQRANAAIRLAEISGYEELARQSPTPSD